MNNEDRQNSEEELSEQEDKVLELFSEPAREGEEGEIKIRVADRVKEFKSMDYSSNVEFTVNRSSSAFPVSLAHIRPDVHNITPQRINPDLADPKTLYYKANRIKKPSQKEQAEEKIEVRPRPQNNLFEGDEVPLYKIWPGRNRFYFKGSIMAGPKTDRVSNSIAWLLIIGVSATFYAIAFPFILGDTTNIMPAISLILTILTVMFGCLTSYTNPGIVPRKCVWELNGEVPLPYQQVRQNLNASNANKSMMNKSNFNKTGDKTNNSLPKFCTICQINQPVGTAHCKDCGNCVQIFDHHSSFLNNCIGKRNYRFYIGFILSLLLMAICYLAGFLIYIIISSGADDPENPDRIFKNDTATLVVILLLGIPTFALCAVILILSLMRMKLKLFPSHKNLDEKELKPSNIKQKKIYSVNWVVGDPNMFNVKEKLNKDQLMKFHRSLTQSIPA